MGVVVWWVNGGFVWLCPIVCLGVAVVSGSFCDDLPCCYLVVDFFVAGVVIVVGFVWCFF